MLINIEMEKTVEEYLAEEVVSRSRGEQTAGIISKEMENNNDKSVEEYLKDFECDQNGDMLANTMGNNQVGDLTVEEYLAKMSRETEEGETGLTEENDSAVTVEDYLKQMEQESEELENGEEKTSLPKE